MESRALREMRDLPNQIVRRIDDAIQGLEENPLPPGSVRVRGRVGDGWRVRVGDYRILYTVDHETRVVRIYRIRHRREAYR
ncbi:MAG TPA: type II toxin-antitoxin system RelE/ParE family toxin [Dehalococcoidia bacterium]|nr:type II toxin-antitoxin system RelE/ParE family toxin [Dehalococcoidia bacterium]